MGVDRALGAGDTLGGMSTSRPPKGLSRGEFARASGLSPKALRLYEGSGLVVPHRVGRGGYRTYLVGQVERARRIALLRRLGMPLVVVAEVVDLPAAQALERVRVWWGSQEEALRERRAALAELGLVWGGQGGAVREPRWRVRCERVEEVKVAAVSARSDQQRLVETFHGCVEWLRRCLREQGARVGREFWVLHHGWVTPDGSAPIEVVVPFGGHAEPVRDMVIRVEAAHERVVCEVARRDCFHPRIMGAYGAVQEWLSGSGVRAVGVVREVYLAPWDEVAEDEVFALVARPIEVGRRG